MIAYSIPLVYQGTVYGVMGVEISENYLAEMLPVRELNSQNQGSYMLAGLAEDGSLDPVSYTHLDVYKRQPYARCQYGGSPDCL